MEKTNTGITLQDAQDRVHAWISTVGVRYFSELTNMAILTEEVGELARIMARKYGDQSFKESDLNLDLGKGLVAAVKGWAAGQLDDRQTVRMPARSLIPGTTLRVEIKHRFSAEARTIEVTLPPDFVVGRPIRLKGLGRKLGPWQGDLYLRFLAV